jgi:hypothetical protein
MRKIKILAPILILGSVGAVTCSLASCSCSKSDHQHYDFTSATQITEYLKANKVENAGDDGFTFNSDTPGANYNFICNEINFEVIRNGIFYQALNMFDSIDDVKSFNVNIYADHIECKLDGQKSGGATYSYQ